MLLRAGEVVEGVDAGAAHAVRRRDVDRVSSPAARRGSPSRWASTARPATAPDADRPRRPRSRVHRRPDRGRARDPHGPRVGRRGDGAARAVAVLARRRAHGVGVPAGGTAPAERLSRLHARQRRDGVHAPAGATLLDDLAVARPDRADHRPGALRAALAAGPVTFYCGFDPTAPSLHIGQPGPDADAAAAAAAGHRPLALVGGATGLIGDPKPTARAHAQHQGDGRRLGRADPRPDRAVPRLRRATTRPRWSTTWTGPRRLSAIDFLRDIGKHFRVNKMITKDAVAARLNSEQGITYTEFSYQILQGLDFLELYRRLRLHAADRWQRPVGQPDRRRST